jgi:transporter family protein
LRPYLLFAMLAGIAWGIGGYFEKAGLRDLGIPPIAGITLRTAIALVILGALSIPAWRAIADPGNTRAWAMIVVGGGIVAGSLGMWAFYSALATSENLGVTLAIAFAMSPVAGTLLGLVRRTQQMDPKIALGLLLVVAGIVLIQLSHRPAAS